MVGCRRLGQVGYHCTVLRYEEGLLWVRNMNEEWQVDLLTKSTMALLIGDVREMRCQLCKQRNEDTIVPICCIGH